jgi:hypothetical protein
LEEGSCNHKPNALKCAHASAGSKYPKARPALMI